MSTDVGPAARDESGWPESAQAGSGDAGVEPYEPRGTAFVPPSADSHTSAYDPPKPAADPVETAAAGDSERPQTTQPTGDPDQDGSEPADVLESAEPPMTEREDAESATQAPDPATTGAETSDPISPTSARAAPDPFDPAEPAEPADPAEPAEPAATPGGGQRAPSPAGPASPPGTRPRRRSAASAAGLLAAALVGGVVGGGVVAVADWHRRVAAGLTVTTVTGPPAAALDGTVTAAAQKVLPSSVAIYVGDGTTRTNGSGIIIRLDGYILTNDHVIAPAPGELTVVLSDGRAASAKVVGRDPVDDLAVIKVDGVGTLTAATFAGSTSLSIGQSVVTVSATAGLAGSVGAGVVSGLRRPVHTHLGSLIEAVQITSRTEPGGSGAPVADLNGSVIGVSTDTAEPGVDGVGFAIPASLASRVAAELVTTGSVSRASLGATAADVSLLDGPGVAITTVAAGGPAAKAGLKVGDVIAQLGDAMITSNDGLLAAVASAAPGQRLLVRYTRRNKAATTQLIAGRAKDAKG